MKKLTGRFLLPLALTAAMPAVMAQSNGEEYYSIPLKTHTFDSQPYNLDSWQRTKSNITFSHGGTAGRNNSKCLTIDCSKAAGNPYGLYIYNVPCKPGQKVMLAVWCKVSKDFPAQAQAAIQAEFYGANKKLVAVPKPLAAVHSAERNEAWQRLTIFAETPANATVMRIALPVRGAKAGKVWYDDLTISAMPENFDPAIEASYSELIHEATFDKQPLNWPSWQTPNGGVVFSKGVPEGRNNSNCLTLDFAKAKKNASGVYLRVFPCQAGKKYMFSAWFKVSEQVKADSLVGMDVVFMDANKKIFKTPLQEVRLNSLHHGNWQRMVFFFEAPANAVNMRVHFKARHIVPGKIWLDDITIKAMP